MKGMSIIVKKVTQLVSGLVFLYGIYIITHGHLTPGGGFAGGAVLAGSFILLALAFGSDLLKLKKREKVSSLIFAIMLLFIGTHIFCKNYLPAGTAGSLISAGVIPLDNIFTGIGVGAALYTIFLALAIFNEEGLK